MWSTPLPLLPAVRRAAAGLPSQPRVPRGGTRPKRHSATTRMTRDVRPIVLPPFTTTVSSMSGTSISGACHGLHMAANGQHRSETRPDDAKDLPTLATSSPTTACYLSSCPEHRLRQDTGACLAQVCVAAHCAGEQPHATMARGACGPESRWTLEGYTDGSRAAVWARHPTAAATPHSILSGCPSAETVSATELSRSEWAGDVVYKPHVCACSPSLRFYLVLQEGGLALA